MPILGHETFGDGPIKLMGLHGWFADERAFRPITQAMSPDTFTFVTVAFRGYGKSRAFEGAFTMQEVADDCLELADHLGWDQFNLIGHSMGGCAMQRVLADAPARVQTLTGITPVPASGYPFPPDRLAWFVEKASDLALARDVVQFSVGTRVSPSFVDHVHRNLLQIVTQPAFAGYLQSWARGDFHQEIVGNPVRVKLFCTEFEHAITPELLKATYLTYYPNADLEILPGAGHYSIDEIPLLLGSRVEHFLRGHHELPAGDRVAFVGEAA